MFPPINLKNWIEDHRDTLKPPVCNKMVFKEDGYIVMVVGGPNQRNDFHIEEGPEFFYQIEGSMVVRTVENGKIIDHEIREGEIFLLPPRVPHSPQRFANTIGLVIERSRTIDEKDSLAWYCEGCCHKLHSESFHLSNIEEDFLPVIDRFKANSKLHICDKCGKKLQLV